MIICSFRLPRCEPLGMASRRMARPPRLPGFRRKRRGSRNGRSRRYNQWDSTWSNKSPTVFTFVNSPGRSHHGRSSTEPFRQNGGHNGHPSSFRPGRRESHTSIWKTKKLEICCSKPLWGPSFSSLESSPSTRDPTWPSATKETGPSFLGSSSTRWSALRPPRQRPSSTSGSLRLPAAFARTGTTWTSSTEVSSGWFVRFIPTDRFLFLKSFYHSVGGHLRWLRRIS